MSLYDIMVYVLLKPSIGSGTKITYIQKKSCRNIVDLEKV